MPVDDLVLVKAPVEASIELIQARDPRNLFKT